MDDALEIKGAQPGQTADHNPLAEWFWGEPYAALVLNQVKKRSLEHGPEAMRRLGRLLLVPRNQMHRFKDQTNLFEPVLNGVA